MPQQSHDYGNREFDIICEFFGIVFKQGLLEIKFFEFEFEFEFGFGFVLEFLELPTATAY
jgi:hypothetical protein